MNPSTTEYIYHNYQKEEYYRQYFKEQGTRVDGRKLQIHRDIKISISENNVIISQGKTIVIAQLKTQLQQVTYSPFSKTFGKQLINVVVKWNSNSKLERNAENALQQFIQQFIDWKTIQQQISYQDQQKNKTFAHAGSIIIRIASSDGCIYQASLLATFFLLWTSSFSIKQTKTFLQLPDFYFPIKYCDILNEVVVDPTSEEEKDSNYEVSFIKNITNTQKDLTIVRHLHVGSLQMERIEGLKKLYRAQLEKLPLNMREVQKKVKEESEKTVNLTISNL